MPSGIYLACSESTAGQPRALQAHNKLCGHGHIGLPPAVFTTTLFVQRLDQSCSSIDAARSLGLIESASRWWVAQLNGVAFRYHRRRTL